MLPPFFLIVSSQTQTRPPAALVTRNVELIPNASAADVYVTAAANRMRRYRHRDCIPVAVCRLIRALGMSFFLSPVLPCLVSCHVSFIFACLILLVRGSFTFMERENDGYFDEG